MFGLRRLLLGGFSTDWAFERVVLRGLFTGFVRLAAFRVLVRTAFGMLLDLRNQRRIVEDVLKLAPASPFIGIEVFRHPSLDPS
jgi:hypothetical protein